jgi:hypothetical protein
MPRVYQPEGSEISNWTIQAQLGLMSYSHVCNGRGHFIGIEQLKEWIDEKRLKAVAHELGILMALIHFVGKNDAYDVELYFGREKNSKKLMFYIADFDLSESYSSLDKKIIKRMAWTLQAVPYFPTSDSPPELLKEFKEGYTNLARAYGISDSVTGEILADL